MTKTTAAHQNAIHCAGAPASNYSRDKYTDCYYPVPGETYTERQTMMLDTLRESWHKRKIQRWQLMFALNYHNIPVMHSSALPY